MYDYVKIDPSSAFRIVVSAAKYTLVNSYMEWLTQKIKNMNCGLVVPMCAPFVGFIDDIG